MESFIDRAIVSIGTVAVLAAILYVPIHALNNSAHSDLFNLAEVAFLVVTFM